MKKIIVGAVLLAFGRIVPFAWSFPFAGSLIIVVGLTLLIWGIVEKARESGGSTGVAIAPLAKTDDLDIFQLSGTVVGIQSRTVINSTFRSSTSGGGGYLYQGTGTVFAPQSYTSSSTSSIEVVRYFIKDDAGEFSFELNNPPLAVRESHRLSTVYAGNSTSSTKGLLVAVVNHDTGKSFLLPYSAGVEQLVKHEMRISGWLLLAMAAVIFFSLLRACRRLGCTAPERIVFLPFFCRSACFWSRQKLSRRDTGIPVEKCDRNQHSQQSPAYFGFG